MANTLTDRIWKVDTEDSDVVDDKPMKVKTVRWVGATTAAHQAIIRDPVTNTTLWEGIATATNNSEAELIETWWRNGFEVPTLDSGILYITLM